jgi:hypothetical protein
VEDGAESLLVNNWLFNHFCFAPTKVVQARLVVFRNPTLVRQVLPTALSG